MLLWLYSRIRRWRKPEVQQNNEDSFDLNTPLLRFSPYDPWTIAESLQGIAIFGGTGSGKTSGPFLAILKAFLVRGYGALILTTKPEDAREYTRWVKEAGREKNLIVISPESSVKYGFNFIQYELVRNSRGGGQTENILNLLTHVLQIIEGKVTQTGDGIFWDRAMREMLRNAIDILALAQGTLTLEDIFQVIKQAPQRPEDVGDIPSDGNLDNMNFAQTEVSEKWWNTSLTAKCILLAYVKKKTKREEHDFLIALSYWTRSFPNLSDRTRSGIVATFTSMADILLHGIAFELLCSESNIVPEVTWQDGAIIIIDLPIQEYGEVGRIVQGIWKYMWQKAVLRRDPKMHPRPVCLVADENQNFVSSFDFHFQSVARSAIVSSLLVTQSLTSYVAVLGSDGQHEANSLLANLATKIFCASSDPATNNYAVDVISKERSMLFNFNSSERGGSGGGSEAILDKILPSEFVTLRTGGEANQLEVDAIIVKFGRVWRGNQDTVLKTAFKQERKTKG